MNNSKTLKRLVYTLTLGVLAFALASCDGSAVSLSGNLSNGSISIDTGGLSLDDFGKGSARTTGDAVFYTSYMNHLTKYEYEPIDIEEENYNILVSSRALPFTLPTGEAATVKVRAGDRISKYLKANLDNGEVHFEIIPGVDPEKDLSLEVKWDKFIQSIPLRMLKSDNWVPISEVSVLDKNGTVVSRPTSSGLDPVNVDVANGMYYEKVADGGRFKISYGEGVEPSNPDLYVESSNKGDFQTRLFKDVTGYSLLVLPNEPGARTTITVTSVEDSFVKAVFRVQATGSGDTSGGDDSSPGGDGPFMTKFEDIPNMRNGVPQTINFTVFNANPAKYEVVVTSSNRNVVSVKLNDVVAGALGSLTLTPNDISSDPTRISVGILDTITGRVVYTRSFVVSNVSSLGNIGIGDIADIDSLVKQSSQVVIFDLSGYAPNIHNIEARVSGGESSHLSVAVDGSYADGKGKLTLTTTSPTPYPITVTLEVRSNKKPGIVASRSFVVNQITDVRLGIISGTPSMVSGDILYTVFALEGYDSSKHRVDVSFSPANTQAVEVLVDDEFASDKGKLTVKAKDATNSSVQVTLSVVDISSSKVLDSESFTIGKVFPKEKVFTTAYSTYYYNIDRISDKQKLKFAFHVGNAPDALQVRIQVQGDPNSPNTPMFKTPYNALKTVDNNGDAEFTLEVDKSGFMIFRRATIIATVLDPKGNVVKNNKGEELRLTTYVQPLKVKDSLRLSKNSDGSTKKGVSPVCGFDAYPVASVYGFAFSADAPKASEVNNIITNSRVRTINGDFATRNVVGKVKIAAPPIPLVNVDAVHLCVVDTEETPMPLDPGTGYTYSLGIQGDLIKVGNGTLSPVPQIKVIDSPPVASGEKGTTHIVLGRAYDPIKHNLALLDTPTRVKGYFVNIVERGTDKYGLGLGGSYGDADTLSFVMKNFVSKGDTSELKIYIVDEFTGQPIDNSSATATFITK